MRAKKKTTISDEEQLARWVSGESVHNGECTPDFSCCRPQLLASQEVRTKYLNAGRDERSAMCFQFLGAMLRDHGCKVVS
jgi:hypothetical protein